ncbi:MAG: energy transducer TonB [Bryobacteraceae bacterium]|jgi:TonB family protein
MRMGIFVLLLASVVAAFGETKPPRIRFKIEPEYTKKALKAKLQGLVALSLVVNTEGNTRDIKVTRSLGMGLDEKAVEAVKKWVFFPATKDGVPFNCRANVDVSFKTSKDPPPVRVQVVPPEK